MSFAIEDQALQWFDEESLNALAEMTIFSAKDFDQVPENICQSNLYDYVVLYDPDSTIGLILLQKIMGTKKAKYLRHGIDIQQFIKQNQGSFPASKKNLFSQAIGRKTQSVIDATGGWLGDSLLMCSQNYPVTVLERHWLLQGFIQEALLRLGKTSWLQSNKAPLPELVFTSAIDYLQTSDNIADCIYIDPMFPDKVKKSAAVRKSMQVLHDLVGEDFDADQLFLAAMDSKAQRIVVKRPDYAASFDQQFKTITPPTETLRGKLVRYDVYIR